MTRLSHKIALDPTAAQTDYFRRACGTARFVYNWALAEWNRQYEAGKKPTALSLKKQFNAEKYESFPWLVGIHRDAHSQPFTRLGAAFDAFFKGSAERPTFKKKGKCRDSFYVANDKITVDGRRVRLPIVGWVRTHEELRFVGKVMSATVSRTAGRWFVSISVEIADASRHRTSDGIVGIDVGITYAAVLSTGEKIKIRKPLARAMRRLQIRSRRLSHTKKGSANWRKQADRMARQHARIANIRADFWHKLSARLCRENQAVGVESLNIAGMLQNRCLSRAVLDSGFGMLVPMLVYKAPLYGTRLVIAGRFYPSSKTCSHCGEVNQTLQLKDREWKCSCGTTHDRDINAARNLANLALPAACGKVTPVSYETATTATRDRNRNASLGKQPRNGTT